jgi:uncharacterized protein
MISWDLVIYFFIIAAVYASAGFGGGSSYLAIMSLYGLSQAVMRPTSLLCNIIVVTGGTYILWRNGFLNFKKIIPLSIASVPMAFIGGLIPLKDKTFFILLGSSLILAALLMIFQKNIKPAEKEVAKPFYMIPLGGSIGLLSGMVGIGGGIFLSPILNLLRWDTPKNIAATASFFILINSISSLIAQHIQGKLSIDWQFVVPLLCAVFLGGQLGSRWSALKVNQTWVRHITAALILYAGVYVLWTHI